MWPVGGAGDRHLSLAVNTCQAEDLRVQEEIFYFSACDCYNNYYQIWRWVWLVAYWAWLEVRLKGNGQREGTVLVLF